MDYGGDDSTANAVKSSEVEAFIGHGICG